MRKIKQFLLTTAQPTPSGGHSHSVLFKLLCLLCFLCYGLVAEAANVVKSNYDYNNMGILYDLYNDNTAIVVGGTKTGKLTIFEDVPYNSQTYKITKIADNAFSGKKGITSVEIGDEVITIGANAFKGCTGITEVTYWKHTGNLKTIGEGAFRGCTSLQKVLLADGVTTIGNYAFYGCTSLGTNNNSFIANGNLTTIGDYAFYGCTNLGLFYGNGSTTMVRNIGNYAFCGCKNLYFDDKFNNTFANIGEHAFENCTSLGVMEFPISNKVENIGNYAFKGCTNLQTFYLPTSNYGTVPTFGEGVFYECTKLKSVTLSGKTTSIPVYAFLGCSALTSISIPTSVTTIGGGAFLDCRALSSVSFGTNPSITLIDDGAFGNCTSLTQLTIGDNATMYASAVDGCTSLTKFIVSSSSVNYSVDNNGVLYNKNKTKLVRIPPAKSSYTIPNTVQTIGQDAFGNCTNLTSLTIPSNVKTIETYGISGSGITSITIPTTVTKMEKNAVHVGKIYCNMTSNMQPPGWNSSWYWGTVYWNQVVTVVPNNTNYGSVTGGGTFTYNTATTIKAIPNSGYMFVRWDDDGENNKSATRTIYATETKTYTAIFMPEISVVTQNNYQMLGLTSDHIGYYIISNVNQLKGFAELVNGGTTDANAVLIADIVVNQNVLKADGSLNNGTFTTWTPIGTKDLAYIGTFDGNGHTISGLYFNDDNISYVGLFGYNSTGTIKNVGVIDSYMRGKQYVSGICGYFNGAGKITSCFNAATVYASNPTIAANGTGDSDAGGICGYMTNASAVIENCHNSGYISAYIRCVGGICGIQFNGTITNCYNTGKIYSYSANNANNNGFSGGITGWMSGSASIENSHNTGNVESIGKNVGGIIGRTNNSNTIINCYNTGKIKGNEKVGGICGYRGTITNCYNTGAIEGGFETGGICGSDCAVSYSYNIGAISGSNSVGGITGGWKTTTNCYNTGTVSGEYYVGGICGFGNDASISMSDCYNIGMVSGTAYYVGGICGGQGKQSKCYYLAGSANDGGAVQNGVGCSSHGQTTSDQSGTISKTTNEFAYGAVALLLNGGTNEGPWFQTVGVDAGPVLDESHGRVGMLATEGNITTASGDVVLLEDYTVEAGKTLVIPANASVSALTTRALINNGRIVCNGNISGFNFSGSGSFVFENLTESDITFNTTSYTYKGSAYTLENGLDVTIGHTICGKWFTYAGTATVTYQNNVNVGANATATWNETITKTFAIAPKEITVNATAQNREYNGTTHASGSISLSGIVGNDNVSATYTSATFADKKVGEGKTVTFSGIALAGNDAANYTLGEQTTATATANITAKTLSFSSITAANKVFDGDAATTVTIVASNIVDGDVVTFGTAAAFADESAGNNKAVSFTFSKSGADAANYVFTNENGEATANIEPKKVSLIWSNTNLIYNGDNQAATATAGDLVSGYDCTVTVSGKQKNQGTYTATATALSNPNYKLPTAASCEFTITPKVVTASASAIEREYNGTTNANGSISLSGVVGNDNVSATYTSAAFADKTAGEGKTVTFSGIALSGADAANYTLGEQTTATATANITAKTLSFSSITAANKVFDGDAATTVTIVASNIVDGDVVTFGTAAVFADESAGNDKAVSFTFSKSGADAANYVFANAIGEATANIEKREVSLTWNSTNLTYNGENQVATATAGNLVSGDVCTVTVSGANKDQGTHTATATVLSNANYKLPIVASQEFTIAPKEVSLAWSNTEFVYNGENQIATATAEGLISGDVCTVNVIGAKKDQGTYTAEAESLSNANYKLPEAKTAQFTIKPKEVSLAWSNTALTYNGENQVAAATAEGLIGEDVCTVTVEGAEKKVGNYTATATALSNDNYKLPEAASQAFAIAPKEVTLAWSNTTLTYNGNEQIATATAEGLFGEDACVVTVEGAAKNVGTHTATAKALDNDNYKLPAVVTSNFKIEPKEVSLVWSNTSLIYNGAEQVAIATAEGLEAGDECTVTVSGEQTNVGTYTATAESLSNGNYKLPEVVTSEFAIAPKAGVVVTVTENSKDVVYNTEEQSVEGYTVSISDELNIYAESDFAFSGNAVAKGTAAGKYAMELSAADFENKNANFDEVEFVIVDGALTIAKAAEAPNKPEATMETRYINTQLVALPENWKWAEFAALVEGDNTATANYDGADKGNYEVESVAVSIKRLPCLHNEGSELLYTLEATCTHKGYTGNLSCKLCGQIYEKGDSIPALGHAYDTVAVAANCTAEGYKELTCSRCNHVEKIDIVPALGHTDSVAYEHIVAATCTVAGSQDSVVYCSVCKAELSRKQVVIPATGHTIVTDAAVAATTTETGLTEGSHCSVCGHVIVAQEIVPVIVNGGGENQGGNEGQGNENQGEENQGGNEGQGNENQGEENQGGNEGQGEENQGEENQGGNEGQGNENQGEENQGGNEGQGEENQGEENQGGNEGQGEENQGEENQGGNEGQGNENQGEENQGGNEGQGNENQGEENQGGNEEGNENQGEENQGGNEEGNENQGEENQGGNEGQGNENQGEENQGGNENEGGNENTNPGTAVDDTDALAVNIFAYGNTIVVENADADILVFDAMGRMISRTIVTTDRTELQVERAGVYVVKTGNTAKRVMIND